MRNTIDGGKAARCTAIGLLSLALCACGAGSASLRDSQGKLQPCDDGPHCVSSESTDAERQVAPLRHDDAPAAAMARLAKVIAAMPGAVVVSSSDSYIHATFTSSLMKFVDDAEFVATASQPGVIQVRSSSRIGYSDLGANRKRVEAIRAGFAAKAG
ncbi:DUF1499 domain-containing protein [Nevskia sp.]|uniref:DUF1499 domain-containing protein n=1 Tax=Nevskia sp. TaxID=1929292 RepID=UPI0025EE7BEE|nr:DUF1499 domain-containing protein [Nevskia sp.]